MRPPRPGNDPYRRDDDRRDRRPNQAPGRARDGYAPPPGSYEPDDYEFSPRDGDAQVAQRRDGSDRGANAPQEPSQGRYRSARPARSYEDRRSTPDADDPYPPRDRSRETRGAAPRRDRPGGGRSEQDFSGEYVQSEAPPRPRYGAISPSDDLAWPDAEPADAEWRPATPRGRVAGSRGEATPSRRENRYQRQPDDNDRDEQFAPPTAQPAWSTFEPAPRSVDDPAYDVAPRSDRAGRRASRTSMDREPAGDWHEGSLNDPAEPDQQDDQWYQTQPDNEDGYEADIPSAADAPINEEIEADELLHEDDPRAAVFSDPTRPSRRTSGYGNGLRPPVWGLSGYAWRFARRLTIARTNRLLRLGASRVLPASSQARFEAMGLPPTEIAETLRQVRSLDDWAEAWTGTAQRFLGETRRGGDMTPVEAARSRQLAALCYHVASFFAFGDDRLARTSRSAATTLFGQSIGLLMPETRRVNVRWRSKTMPGYLTVPSWATGRRPLAVLLNGATTSREELILWSDEFLAQGLAVLAIDTPGFGEGVALGTVSLDNDDILDGIFELAESDPGLDPSRVSLVGISLGGTMAFRAAAGDRRISAVVAVTPIFEPARWLGASSQVSLAQLVLLFGSYDQLADFVLGLDLPTTLAETQAQVLVFGAGKDLVVPPPEASRLAAALGEQATLVWFDDAGHALFDVVPEWTREAAEWLAVVMDVSDAPIFTETGGEEESGPYPEDSDSFSEGNGESAGTQFESAPGTYPDPDAETPVEPEDDPEPSRRQPLRRREAGRSATQNPPEQAPVPEPYGNGVFDASEGAERRSEQQRGYETGVFGPLGPAAARILADEPTPQPGTPEWGYEDDDSYASSELDVAPWDESPTRSAPSTARLWESPESQARSAFHPTLAEPTGRDRGSVPANDFVAGSAASRRAPTGGDYLTPSSPSVGRGRTSEPFTAVPTADPVQPGQTDSSDAHPESRPFPSVDGSGVADGEGNASGNDHVADEPIGRPESDEPVEPDHPVTPDDDTHAPFRPRLDRSE